MSKRMRTRIAGVGLALALPFAAAAQAPSSAGCEPLAQISGPALFADNCTQCHGDGGKGGGILAKALELAPPDLTTLTARTGGAFPSEHVLQILRNGGGHKGDGDKAMPVWAKIFAHECGGAYARQAVLELERTLKAIQESGSVSEAAKN